MKDCKCKKCGCGQQQIDELLEQTEDDRRPYWEDHIDSNTFIRHFDYNMPDHLYKWHYDLEDRTIEPQHKNDWKFQFDNKLPITVEDKINIPAGVYHRLIKGTGSLALLIKVKP